MTNVITKEPTWIEYQRWVGGEGFYPGKRVAGEEANINGITYAALGLTGEAGEVADKIKKVIRDHDSVLTPELRDGIIKEMGDTLWYLTALANELGVYMSDVARINVEKIEGRNARGTRRGEGDDR